MGVPNKTMLRALPCGRTITTNAAQKNKKAVGI
jgi:hypothetical protein